ncbi:aldehyde dehydrogenase (NAD+) [Neolewinella xylanilytica]|uniref:Aldehyde dehydrogenase n=1 Tax=Neolewinella xylanilytica TaxID=1514080 RepID=A0A2S6I6Q1_9BACT|nr:aldehyde dehydrogenase family protein [Neolewinella xylanilytica]PPK87174.1 aldehyde dehydrogenase (NAD+) [Neolewinella xylanilytica]
MPTAASTADYAYLLREQQAYAPTLAKSTAKERKEKLGRILRYLDDERNTQRLIDALKSDLQKPEVETRLSEIGPVYSHVKYINSKLTRWMEPRRISTPLAMLGTMNYVYYEPKGCALVIAPWNYPFNLAMVPVLYAIAAGCTVVLKPSEHSPATTEFMRAMFDKLFADNEIAVVKGEAETSAALTRLPFNHVFFTGSPAVGKKVMAAAAENLASVTLELGGKSPCIVDADVNLKNSARNVVWGKGFNAGQTCIAPDYLMVNDAVAKPYVSALCEAVTAFYGEDPQASDSYARIVNNKQFDHLTGLLEDAIGKGAQVVCGGRHDRADRYFAPTILTGVTREMRVMREEIFGPILPVMTFNNLTEVVAFVNRLPKPLAFYIQAKNRRIVKRLLAETSAGGTLVNEFFLSNANPALPFGGINNSGIGKSYGYHGFLDFTNQRAVVERKFLDLSSVYPPYTDKVKSLVRRIYRW